MAPTITTTVLDPTASTFIPGLFLNKPKRTPLPEVSDLPNQPPTPTLAQSSQFDSFHQQPQTPKLEPLLPQPQPSASESSKIRNPYFNFEQYSGDSPAETYYRENPIMRAYQAHRQQHNYNARFLGPFRKAAVWEFIGTTYEKGQRNYRLDKKQRRRRKDFRRDKRDGTLDFSPLYEEVFTTEEEDFLMEDATKSSVEDVWMKVATDSAVEAWGW